MTELRLVQVDAFAEQPFTGNPAAVVPLDEWLPDETLQAIAMENNLSETAFTVPAEGDADYELRWFTPTTEVVRCGDATFAAGHFLRADNDRLRCRARRAGMLEVTRGDGADRYSMSLPSWKPAPKPLPKIVDALGVAPLETLWHEHRYGLVIVESEEEVLGLDPDYKALAADGDVLTIVSARGTRTDIMSRVFAPGAGIDEDPVTGSAHAVMVPYWAERLGRDTFNAWQASRRGGYLDCRLAGDRVILGGRCVTVIDGTLRF